MGTSGGSKEPTVLGLVNVEAMWHETGLLTSLSLFFHLCNGLVKPILQGC